MYHPVTVEPNPQYETSMGTMFANAPFEPTVAAVQVMRIYFDASCRFCRDGRLATTNIRHQYQAG